MNATRKFAALSVVGLGLLAGGCASSDINEIPKTAAVMGDSRGDITWSAPHDGMVYVYDSSNNELVYSGQVNAGDSVNLNMGDKDVRINGRKVASDALIHDHRHQIYFDNVPGSRTVIEKRTTVVEPAPQSSRTTIVAPAPDVESHSTTVVGPDGRRTTTVVTPAPEQKETTIITTPHRD